MSENGKIYRWKATVRNFRDVFSVVAFELGKTYEWNFEKRGKPKDYTDGGFCCADMPMDVLDIFHGSEMMKCEMWGGRIRDGGLDTWTEAWSNMKVVGMWRWKKEDMIRLALFILDKTRLIYDAFNHGDKRLNEGMKAIGEWIKKPGKKKARIAQAKSLYHIDRTEEYINSLDLIHPINHTEIIKSMLKSIAFSLEMPENEITRIVKRMIVRGKEDLNIDFVGMANFWLENSLFIPEKTLKGGDGCELCNLEKKTKWHFENDEWIVCDCISCEIPMIVSKKHRMGESPDMSELCKKIFGDKFSGFRKTQRRVSDHLHYHIVLRA